MKGKDEIMKLQERFSALSPIYSGGLTNHLPMMITALRLLDVEEQEIERISENYVNQKNIVDLSNSGIENDAFNDEYIRLTNFYMNEISHKSVESILQKTLNELQFSLHSGLFHGMIRVAYGYLEGEDLLVAQGLAYFSLIADELCLEGEVVEDLNSSFEQLLDFRKGLKLKDNGTMNKMSALLGNTDIVNSLFIPVDILNHKEKALELFVDYYNKTKDFYILHVITGFHALHVLSQFFNEEEQVYNNFFRQALVVLLMNPHDQYKDVTIELESFPALTKRIPTLTDAHDIKLFFSLAYFYERYQMDSLLLAANLIFKQKEE